MKNQNISLKVLPVLFLLAFIVGCKGGYSGFVLENFRGVQVYVITSAEAYVVDAELGFRIDASGGEHDQGLLIREMLTKVEIDPGDSGEWLDFTEGFFATLGTYDPIGIHVYTEPGEYTVRTRVTYWDGEVLVDPGGQRTITVLPAE